VLLLFRSKEKSAGSWSDCSKDSSFPKSMPRSRIGVREGSSSSFGSCFACISMSTRVSFASELEVAEKSGKTPRLRSNMDGTALRVSFLFCSEASIFLSVALALGGDGDVIRGDFP